MSRHDALWMVLLASACSPAAALAQGLSSGDDTRQEVRPEVDIYVEDGSRIRFIFQNLILQGVDTRYSEPVFAYFVEFALRPVFRRQLRGEPDVFRNRYLTFRIGHQFMTSLISGSGSHENRIVIELTARYPLARGFVLKDRNRGELRFVNGEDFSSRYRNRVWLQRDFELATVALTPYVYDEMFFDTRYNTLSTNRVVCGAQFPVADKLVIEPYVLRQTNYRGSLRRVEAAGLKLSFFF